jgi:DnaJ-class molecular chaperone
MISGSEMKALKTVVKENGETTTRLVSRQLGIDSSYAVFLCTNLIKSAHLARETRGRFKITPKGKKALGWSHEDSPIVTEPAIPGRKIQKEEFQWRSLRSVPAVSTPTGGGFFKPGQEDVTWRTMDFGNNGRPGRFNRSAQTSLINEKTHACGLCKGTGKKAKGTSCPVCKGAAQVTITPPAVSCGFCKGRGIERKTGRICPVCRGKGVVSVHPPIGICNSCQGSGMEQGTGLTCLKCGGKGVIHIREMVQIGRN